MIPVVATYAPLELFLDLDGVFANFDLRVFELTGKWPHELASREMWKAVDRDEGFFLNLAFMPGAETLWAYAKQYRPTFLTGAPSRPVTHDHKRTWVAEKFGSEWRVIVLPSKDKQIHAHPTAILVDDRDDNIQRWVDAGGIGILHDGDVQATIGRLEQVRTTF